MLVALAGGISRASDVRMYIVAKTQGGNTKALQYWHPEGKKEPVTVESGAVLTSSDLSAAKLIYFTGVKCGIAIQLSKIGAEKFAEFSKHHVGNELVLAVDDKVAVVSALTEPIVNGGIMLSGGLPKNVIEDIVKIINDAPTEK